MAAWAETMTEPESQSNAPLQTPSEQSIQRLYERTYARYEANDLRFLEPTALDAALLHVDEAVHELTAISGMSNDQQTASMLLAYAVNVALGKPSPEFLAALDQRQIDPAVTQTIARAVTSLALAVIAWARDMTDGASAASPQTSHTPE